MKKYVLALMFMSTHAVAGEGTLFKYFVSAAEDRIANKGLSVGYQSEHGWLQTKLEGGFWADTRPGTRSSAFGFAGIGVEPQSGPIYLNFFQSIGGITHTDNQLGGNFQFMEEFGIGFRDPVNLTAIGFFYRHISNAGLVQPNRGRDYLGIQIMIPW